MTRDPRSRGDGDETGPRRRGLVPNIGPDGRRRRFGFAAIGFSMAVSLLAVLMAGDVAPPWRAAVFPLFWIGFLGLFQAAGRT